MSGNGPSSNGHRAIIWLATGAAIALILALAYLVSGGH